MSRRRNRGWFKPGKDARRRRGFTREECVRGYDAAVAKAQATSPDLQFWLCVKIYGYYGGKDYRST